MAIIQIASPQNATLKRAVKLRTRRGREDQQRIIIDGQRELEHALSSDIEFEAIFCSENEPAERWFDRVPDVYVVADRAFEKLAFGNRREAVGIAKTPQRELHQLALPPQPRLGVLEGIEKPGNMGAIMRSADGAGLDALIMIDLRTDLFNPNAIRASLGTIFSLQVATATFGEYQQWIQNRPLHQYLAICDADAVDYRHVNSSQECAIVLGNEAVGLSDHWRSIENATPVVIPMRGSADSLNVASAAAVFFYRFMS